MSKETGKDRRSEILIAARELFARRGFRGTTTRDLAAHAAVNEAIIFRYFKTKQDLYSAILDKKACEHRDSGCGEMEKDLTAGDDVLVFSAVGRSMLKRLNEENATFFRLLLYSGLEGHELAEMFFSSYVRPGREALASYIRRRIEEGAFRPIDPNLAVRAFIGMFVSFVLGQEVFDQKRNTPYEPEQVIETFVSIFLSGIKK